MAMNSMTPSASVLNHRVLERMAVIEQKLDKHLESLDSLHRQTEREEAAVMRLIREQRLLEERLQKTD
jgi:hypothetical protein